MIKKNTLSPFTLEFLCMPINQVQNIVNTNQKKDENTSSAMFHHWVVAVDDVLSSNRLMNITYDSHRKLQNNTEANLTQKDKAFSTRDTMQQTSAGVYDPFMGASELPKNQKLLNVTKPLSFEENSMNFQEYDYFSDIIFGSEFSEFFVLQNIEPICELKEALKNVISAEIDEAKNDEKASTFRC